MDIQKGLDAFIEKEVIKDPSLNGISIAHLKVGFVNGVEYYLRSEVEALEAEQAVDNV